MVKDEEDILTLIEQAGLLDYLLDFRDVTKHTSYEPFIEGRRYELVFDDKADIRPIIANEKLTIRSFSRKDDGTLKVVVVILAEPQMLGHYNTEQFVKKPYLSDLEGMSKENSW